jgi:hypothetical protein
MISNYTLSSIAESLHKKASDFKHKLFGSHEEEPKELDIWIGTWNLNGRVLPLSSCLTIQIPHIDIQEFVGGVVPDKKRHHILVLGSQECMATNSSIPKTAEWDKILLEKVLPMGYKLVKSETLYALTLHVFISIQTPK